MTTCSLVNVIYLLGLFLFPGHMIVIQYWHWMMKWVVGTDRWWTSLFCTSRYMAESFCDCDDLRILILIVMDVGIFIFVPQTHFKVRTLSEEVKTLPRTWLFWYARKKVLDRWLCQTRLLKTRGWIYLVQTVQITFWRYVGFEIFSSCSFQFLWLHKPNHCP